MALSAFDDKSKKPKAADLETLILPLVIAVVLVSIATVAETATAEPQAITWGDLSFELPGEGWERMGEREEFISFGRKVGDHHGQAITIESVEVPPELHSSSRQELAMWFFHLQRKMGAPADKSGEQDQEEERRIGEASYPVMTIRKVMDTEPPAISEARYLLYFPDDFESSYKFYCFIWTELYPDTMPVDFEASLNTFDEFIASAISDD
jgi:hypothetical protein